MGFKAVWGFDPEEVERAKKSFQEPPVGAEREEVEPGLDREPGNCAWILSSSASQIYELRRMFRL